MASQSPVFIGGVPRSGTTLLNRLLESHSSFRAAGTEHNRYGESTAFDAGFPFVRRQSVLDYMQLEEAIFNEFLLQTSLALRLRKYLYWMCLYMHTDESQISPFLCRMPIPAPFLKPLAWLIGKSLIFRTEVFRKLFWRASLGCLLTRNFFYFAAKARHCPRIVEKTPANIFKIPEIFTSFPQAKFICIYRHPVEVYSSMRKRLRKDEVNPEKTSRALGWLRLTIDQFVQTYDSALRIALDFSQRMPDQCMMVKYEDLVCTPMEILSEVAKFLGEPFDGEFQNVKKLDVAELNQSQNGDSIRVVRKTKEWQEWLSSEDAVRIEKALACIMSRLGYESVVS